MGYPRHQRARDFKFFTRMAGDLSLTSASSNWTDLPTIGTTWDIVLQAQTSDTLECGFSSTSDHLATTNTFFDVFTVVSAAALNAVSSGAAASNTADGVAAWWHSGAVAGQRSAGSVMYALQSGDVVTSAVTLRLRYRNDGSGTRNLHAAAPFPLHFWAKNLGPVDPN